MAESGTVRHPEIEVHHYSERRQAKFGDCFQNKESTVCPENRSFSIVNNDLSGIRQAWKDLPKDEKLIFNQQFGYIGDLLDVQVEVNLLRAALEFWDPSYRCFSFGEVDLAPNLEEISMMIGINVAPPIKVYESTAHDSLEKMLYQILGLGQEVTARHIEKSGNQVVIDVKFLIDFVRGAITAEKGKKGLALLIYGLVLFPTSTNKINSKVVNLFHKVSNQRVNPVPTVLAEIFRSLNYCRKNRSGKFHASAALLNIWLRSHFKFTQTPLRRPLGRDYRAIHPREMEDFQFWMRTLFSLKETNLKWISEFYGDKDVLWKTQGFDYIPLPGVWGLVGFTPLMILRQFGIRQFVPATDFLKDDAVDYSTEGYKKKMLDAAKSWKKMEYIIKEGGHSEESTPSYQYWTANRVRDIPKLREWVVDPERLPPPVKETTLLEKYKEKFDKEIQQLQTERRDLQRKIYLQETDLEAKARAADYERQQRLQATKKSQAMEKEISILKKKIEQMEKVAKIRAAATQEVEKAKKEFSEERQRWENEKKELTEALHRQRQQLKRKAREEESSDYWKTRYEELEERFDHQVTMAQYELESEKGKIKALQEELEDLPFRERQKFNCEMDQHLNQWAKERSMYRTKIEELIGYIRETAGAASGIYARIQAFREHVLYKDVSNTEMADFLNQILLEARRAEQKFVPK